MGISNWLSEVESYLETCHRKDKSCKSTKNCGCPKPAYSFSRQLQTTCRNICAIFRGRHGR